jgi:signal transduction histidine kinase/ActR/RegA family two-component response regulator
MLNAFQCILQEYDLPLLAAAAGLCVISSLTAFRLFSLTKGATGRSRWLWLCLTGLVAGGGAWATHFVSMLAYSPDLPIQFLYGRTFASLALAVVGAGAGVYVAAGSSSRRASIIGGGIVGLSISGMHYLGITGTRAAVDLEWRPIYVAMSIFIAVTAAGAAFLIARRSRSLGDWAMASLLLSFAICGLHFVGMAGLLLTPDLTGGVIGAVINRITLAAVIGGVSALVLLASIAVIIIDSQSRRLAKHNVEDAFMEVTSGLALFDAKLRLITWNPAYAEIVGRYGIRPAPDMSLLNLIEQAAASGQFPDSMGRTEEWCQKFIADRLTSDPNNWQFPDGRWLRMEYCKKRDGGFLSIMKDVSEQMAAAAELIEARDKAEAANRAKSDFLANMSHEIRTPLNGILGMAQVMEAGALSEVQRGRLNVLRESGEALLGILNDLLDFSKAQAGKLELVVADVDIADLVASCCAAFDGMAAAKGVKLAYHIDDRAKGYWRADGPRLRQVLSNLISNGLKFTPEGAITVRLDRGEQGLALSVEDTGIGMEPDQIPRLFEKFTQADASATRRYGGTGLGLSISRELVGLMAGEITATSQPGEGSCFTIRLPLAVGHPPVVAPASNAAAQPLYIDTPLRILAAEDNMTNQLVLRSLLEPLNVRLVMVETGVEAVSAAQAEVFDVILMDIQMPKMNGVEATRRIRADEKAARRTPTPILALSANVMAHQVDEYIQAGMNGCIAKPIQVAELYAALELATTVPDQNDTAAAA